MKKNLSSIIIVILILIILVVAYFFLFADTNKITNITINNKNITLFSGESEEIDISILPNEVSKEDVVWESSNSEVASVEMGKVNAISIGTTIITAKSKNGKISDTSLVKVIKREIESIELIDDYITLEVGNEKELSYKIIPEKLQKETVTWESSDSSIATVNNGIVLGISNGEVTITAKAGNKEATCNVVVVTPVESIKLDNMSLTIDVDATKTLTPIITPETASNKKVTWSSSDSSIVSVSNGIITGIKEGEATITAETEDGKKTATCNVKVIKREEYKVNFTDSNKTITRKDGDEIGTLPVPTKQNYKFLGWYTDKNNGVKIVENTIVKGNMTLYAHWKFDGNLEIHFIASGFYDDAILIRSNTTTIFMDGGRGKDRVVPYLKELGVSTIDYVIGSHTEYDHIDAQGAVIRTFNVKNVLYPNNIYSCGCSCDNTDVRSVLSALSAKGLKAKTQGVPSKLQIGDMTLYFIAPFKIGCNKNNNSFIFILQYGNTKFMFTGDADSALNDINKLQSNARALGLPGIQTNVFKYPHHGNQMLSNKLIQTIGPQFLVVPNYGASRLGGPVAGVPAYRQSDSSTGNILVTSDGTNVKAIMNVVAKTYKR